MRQITFYINGQRRSVIVPHTDQEWISEFEDEQATNRMVNEAPKITKYLSKLK